MATFDKTFIRAFNPTAEESKACDALESGVGFAGEEELSDPVDETREIEIRCDTDLVTIDSEIQSSVDVGLTWKLELKSTGLAHIENDTNASSVDAKALQVQKRGRMKPTVQKWRPRWEVDRFELSKACQVIGAHSESLEGIVADSISLCEQGNHRFAVRSWSRGAGRTTIAICIARLLGELGYEAVVLDADLDNPELSQQLGVDIAEGWEAIIAKNASLADTCVKSIEDNFTIVPLKSSKIAIHQKKVQHRLNKMLNALSENFDFVLIDTQPGSQIWDHQDIQGTLASIVVHDLRNQNTKDFEEFLTSLSAGVRPVVGKINNFSKAA